MVVLEAAHITCVRSGSYWLRVVERSVEKLARPTKNWFKSTFLYLAVKRNHCFIISVANFSAHRPSGVARLERPPGLALCQEQRPRQSQGVEGRFRGGLVFKAHKLCVSLNSRLESNQEEEEGRLAFSLPRGPSFPESELGENDARPDDRARFAPPPCLKAAGSRLTMEPLSRGLGL